MSEETTGTSLDSSGVTVTKRFADLIGIKKSMRNRINRKKVHVSVYEQINKIIKRGV